MTQSCNKLTTTDVDAQFLDQFRQVTEIINLFRDFDFSLISRLLNALKEFNAGTDIKSKVKAGLQVLAVLAEATPTQADNQLLAVVTNLLTDDVLDILTRLVSSLSGGAMSTQDVLIQAHDRTVVTAKGIPWSLLVQVALRLVDLLDRFAK